MSTVALGIKLEFHPGFLPAARQVLKGSV